MSGPAQALRYLLSFLVALLLQMVVVPAWLAPARPLWLPMALAFWSLHAPAMPNLTAALILGVCEDALYGVALGGHAMALLLVVYLSARLRTTLTLAPWWQEALVLAPVWALYAATLAGVDAVTHHPAQPLLRWAPVAVTTLAWRPVAGVLRRLAPAEPAA